jgi:hypothetical protein
MLVTICRLYETYDEADETTRALEAAGVASSEISIISNNAGNWYSTNADASVGRDADSPPVAGNVEGDGERRDIDGKADRDAEGRDGRLEAAGIGAAIGATAGTAAGLLTLLAIPGAGPVVGLGWLLPVLGGAAIGGVTGGLVGALTRAGLSEEDAQAYAEGLRRGGTLVTARVSEEDLRRVEGIMGPSAVIIGDRRAAYRNSGWRSFDPSAAPYTPDQVRNERQLHIAR